MLIGTFINVVAIPAYQTLLGLGKASVSIVSSAIVSGGNFILVVIIAVFFNHASPASIFGGVIFFCALSSIYLIKQASLEMESTFSEED